MSELADQLRAGDRRALARALSRVEAGGEAGYALLAELFPYTGHAHVVGITGAPGSGKSTLVSSLVAELRRREKRVGVIAVDPSSPYTGGALLGDRIRMGRHSGDPGVFIRSMASRGALGGLARTTGDAIAVMDAAGFDLLLIETVGAGQSEVEIAREAQSTIVVQVPGLGDDVQAIKAGLLEIADIFVVNKADHPHANQTVASLRMMLDIANTPYDWLPPVLRTVATVGEGVSELADELDRHRAYLIESGLLAHRQRERAAEEFRLALRRELLQRLRARAGPSYDALIDRIAARELDPHSAAVGLIGEVGW